MRWPERCRGVIPVATSADIVCAATVSAGVVRAQSTPAERARTG